MDFIDIDNGIAFFLQAFHHLLYTFLKVTPVLCSCKHCSHIHLIDSAFLQSFRNIPSVDTGCQTIYQRRLSHARFSHMQRIVLVGTAKHLNGPFHLLFTTYERVKRVSNVIHTCHE